MYLSQSRITRRQFGRVLSILTETFVRAVHGQTWSVLASNFLLLLEMVSLKTSP